MDIVFLYTELAGYTVSCLNHLAKATEVRRITVVRYPVNPEAPFHFSFDEKIDLLDKEGLDSLPNFISNLNPDLVVCAGWSDKDYLKTCLAIRKKTTLVLTMDNQWSGSVKQKLFRCIAPFVIPKIYDYIWVPGSPQAHYARKIGFHPKSIKTGFYSTDIRKFSALASEKEAQLDHGRIPKVLISVARYIPVKEWDYLWDEFLQFKKTEQGSDWELWCIGTGEDFEKRRIADGIVHHGFLQLDELLPVMLNAGYFVLASSFEPWGVVVEEFAAAGFPLILSEAVGASHDLLDGNGYRFKTRESGGLSQIFDTLASQNLDEYKSMSFKSRQLAKQYDLDSWTKTLLSFNPNFAVDSFIKSSSTIN